VLSDVVAQNTGRAGAMHRAETRSFAKTWTKTAPIYQNPKSGKNR
jgi:hypothetical protein